MIECVCVREREKKRERERGEGLAHFNLDSSLNRFTNRRIELGNRIMIVFCLLY
jgi:hypothetical protein